jgi:hypothetical protein
MDEVIEYNLALAFEAIKRGNQEGSAVAQVYATIALVRAVEMIAGRLPAP